MRKTDLIPGCESHQLRDRKADPLRTRGWALQEWLLSPRILHFTTNEILWECRSSDFFQCQPLCDPDRVGQVPDQRICFSGLMAMVSVKGYCGPWPFQHFREAVHQRSCRLPALSGQTAFRKAGTPEDYVAGLWKPDLPGALLWQALDTTHESATRPNKYCAPTWSWASVVGSQILLLEGWENDGPAVCEIPKVSCTLASSNPYGAFKDGFIYLKAFVSTWSGEIRSEVGDEAAHMARRLLLDGSVLH